MNRTALVLGGVICVAATLSGAEAERQAYPFAAGSWARYRHFSKGPGNESGTETTSTQRVVEVNDTRVFWQEYDDASGKAIGAKRHFPARIVGIPTWTTLSESSDNSRDLHKNGETHVTIGGKELKGIIYDTAQNPGDEVFTRYVLTENGKLVQVGTVDVKTKEEDVEIRLAQMDVKVKVGDKNVNCDVYEFSTDGTCKRKMWFSSETPLWTVRVEVESVSGDFSLITLEAFDVKTK